ncbi:MAG: MerR family transcriptional regulator [Candidatus Lokiarchaeota archaeon]|nr:MerR family transcriptional regulator [Candidatus Lokiarchaeota archaeon]
MKTEYSLMELSEKTGISPRNIRYYISKNLLEGPAQVGRNAIYTENHLNRLQQIKEMKEQGLSLHEIAVEAQDSRVTLSEPSTWVQYALEEDVQVSIRSDISPWRMQQIKKALNQILPQIQKNGDEK